MPGYPEEVATLYLINSTYPECEVVLVFYLLFFLIPTLSISLSLLSAAQAGLLQRKGGQANMNLICLFPFLEANYFSGFGIAWPITTKKKNRPKDP